jgi:fumarylacetoacetase
MAVSITYPSSSSWWQIPVGSDFSLANLPFGVVARPGHEAMVVVRVGDSVVDLAAAGIEPELTAAPALNQLMASGRGPAVRLAARDVLLGPPRPEVIVPLADVTVLLPIDIGDYVDFYASEQHATNLGKMFRPDGDALLPNWKHLPVGYHGRAGSVVVSGTDVVRPSGLALRDGEVRFGPSTLLDIELEVGFVVGRPGNRIDVDHADQYVFGAVLLNDWSARDIQSFEYQPLGPHLGKSFATTISPWVVTIEALREAGTFCSPPAQDPIPADYLRAEQPWALNLDLEVHMNDTMISSTSFREMYWTFAQMLAHMTVNGASVRTGDLFGSGTVSGAAANQRGSLIELTWRGTEPLTLADGSTRTFLQDGDTIVLRGSAGSGSSRIGFGDCTGTILPAP